MIDVLTTAILASATYDLLKAGVSLSIENFKSNLKDKVQPDVLDAKLASAVENINQLNLSGFAKQAIEQKFNNCNVLSDTQVNGDLVFGDKITNNYNSVKKP